MAPGWAAEVWARPSEVPWVMAASGLGNHHCHPQTPCACLSGAVQLCRSKPQSPFWLLTGIPAKTVPKMRFGSLPSEHSRRAEMEVLLLFVALLQGESPGNTKCSCWRFTARHHYRAGWPGLVEPLPLAPCLGR